MDVTLSLQNALTGLQAAQANLAVISSNISNAQTPGYSRETVPLYEQIVGDTGAGVLAGLPQRQVDQNLANSAMQQDTVASAANAINTYFQQIQGLFGQVNDGNSLGDIFNKFSSAMQTLSTSPNDPLAQQGVNAAITHAKAAGQSTATLEDQRDRALDQIAKLIGVQDFVRPDGTMVVLTTSGQVLVDSTAQQLSYTAAGTVTAGTQLSPLKVGNTDITQVTTSGEIGALLSMRDTQLPNLTDELNQFTNQLFNATQSANLATTNSGLGATNDANHFFAAVDTTNGVDNSATIQINPDLVTNPGLLAGPAANPDPTISQALANAVTSPMAFAPAGNFANGTTATLATYAGQILGQSASAAAAASDNATFQSHLQTAFAARASAVSGVNIDQEL